MFNEVFFFIWGSAAVGVSPLECPTFEIRAGARARTRIYRGGPSESVVSCGKRTPMGMSIEACLELTFGTFVSIRSGVEMGTLRCHLGVGN